MKTQITFLKIILPALLVWVHVMSGQAQTTDIISVKTTEVAKYTNTHKQWRFEAVSYRIFNTVANKYLTGHTNGSVSLEAKDESSTASTQYWVLFYSPYGGVHFRNVGTAVSPSDYLRTLSFVATGEDNGTGTTTLAMNLLTTWGSGYSELNINNAPNLTPIPGTSYTINTINWYTRSIVANTGNTGIEAIDNNDNTSYDQWQFEVVTTEPTYPEMTYYKRIYNTKAQKFLTAVDNSGTYSTVLNPIDQTSTANLQYWTIVTGNYGSIMIRNFGAGGINDLHQGSGADLGPAGTNEVNLTTANGPGGALLQLDNNSVKAPVPGTDYSIQSISWYARSLISNIVDNTGGNLTAAGLTDSELANSNFRVNSGELAIDASKTIKSIVVAPGAKLTISSALTATNGITLQSDATGTATLKNSGTYSGTVTAQQYLGSARNWYVSSPVQTTNSPANNIARYYEYVEAGNNNYPKDGNNNAINPGETSYWKFWTTGSPMTVGKGYIAQASAGTTVSFSGTPNNGDITTTFDLTRNDTKGKGFNLVGNPYPSYIDWTDVATANPILDNTYYYRTKNIDNTYAFVTWNGSGNTFVNSKGGTASTTITRFIPPSQAFWVRVKSGISTTKMNFNNGMREHRDDNGNLMKAKRQEQRATLRLQLTNGAESDETLIYTDANAVNEYDSFDSPKMMNNSAVTPDLYSKVGDERLVINGLNILTDNTELPLGFCLNASATLKLKATEMSNLPIGTRVYLRDKQQNIETELTPQSEYTFSTTESTSNNESRFILIFRAPGSTTGIEKDEKLNLQLFVNAANQITIIAPEKASYSIFNAVGQLIENGVVNTKHETQNTKLKVGVYMVKVNNQSTRVIIK